MKQTIKPIGQEINTLGKVINNKELMLVHLHLKSGEQIPSHDHKGQEVFFTIVAGTVEVALDDTEIHRISTGTVLHFPGEAHVGVNAIEESDFSFTSSTDNNVMDMKNTCRVQTLRNSVKYSRLKRHTNEEIFHWKRVEPE